jgi:hypothetical protein
MGKFGFSVAEEKLEQTAKQNAKYDWFKVTDKPQTIRFLTLDGNESILTYAEHYTVFKNTWTRSSSCPDYDQPGQTTCIICNSKKGPNSGIKKDQYGVKFLMQIIARDESGEDKIKVFKFSPFLWTTLLAFYKEYSDLGDRDYEISMVKEIGEDNKEKTRYIVEPVSKRAVALTAADKALADTRAALTDIEPSYDALKIQEIMEMEELSNKPKQEVSKTVNDFMANLAKNKMAETELEEKAPVNTTEPEEDEDDTAEFFKTLKKHQSK